MKRNLLLVILFLLMTHFLAAQVMPVPFTDGEKWGYATNPERKIVIPLKYSECKPFNKRGLALVVENGQNLVIDIAGKEILRVPEGSMIQQFTGKIFMVSRDGKYGVYNLDNGTFTGFKYTSMDAFSEGYAPYNMDSASGLLMENGTEFFHGKFEKVYWPSEGLCAAMMNGKWGYVDMNGNFVIQPKYGFAEPFSEGLAAVGNGFQNAGFIDKTGAEIIPLEYGRLFGAKFHDGIVNVMKNGQFGCLDSKGNVIVPLQYGTARYEGDGVFTKSDGSKRIFFDGNGRNIIDQKTFPVTLYSNGLFRVTRKNTSSFIDKKGKYKFPFVFDFQSMFTDGIALVKYNDKLAYIDTTGRMYCTFAVPVELLSAEKRDLLGRSDTITLFNNYWIALLDDQVQIFDSLGTRIPPMNLVSFTTKDKYAVFGTSIVSITFMRKMKPVTGNEEKNLSEFYRKVDLITWYRAWNDSLPAARKATWVKLGNYKWAIRDLSVTRFMNGDTIYQAKDEVDFRDAGLNNKPAMFSWAVPGKEKEGPTTVYTMAAIKDKRGLIPAGYKIAGNREWQDLMNFSGGDSIAGQFLMNIGFSNQGTIDKYGNNNNLMSLWLLQEQVTAEYISAIMMTPLFGGKMNETALPAAGIAVRCVKVENKAASSKPPASPKSTAPPARKQ